MDGGRPALWLTAASGGSRYTNGDGVIDFDEFVKHMENSFCVQFFHVYV